MKKILIGLFIFLMRSLVCNSQTDAIDSLRIFFIPWATESVTNFAEQDLRGQEAGYLTIGKSVVVKTALDSFNLIVFSNSARVDTSRSKNINVRMIIDVYYEDSICTIKLDRWKNYVYKNVYYRYNLDLILWLNSYVTATQIGDGKAERKKQIVNLKRVADAK